MKMQTKVEDLDTEVNELDKEMAILTANYESIAKALEQTNLQLQDTNKLLNKFCTKLEKESVIIDSLERDMQKYQQYLYGIIVAVVVFIIQQLITMIH